ncbi:ketosteroid isomerase-like protein [Dysgonomonas hofstadii]|uniref:Ketosteroid isomerase-like protein n=1 Tax=Dysgonomonas hofstadii TaxID=637886 RepID=A0A840CP44_9BACT|nr:DUF4440 domain-containing protein [Dysgonomonas hofstadii]MBB4035868.1 ketosteroid isomerase-like protein [Dysgonomonas hofstadii]
MGNKTITDMIIALETAALERWNNGDPSGYLAIYDEEFTYFDPFQEKRLDGFGQIKELYERLRGGAKVDRYEMINPVVQHAGEMAVLTYNLLSYSGDDVYKWNCTEVYKWIAEEQWKIIHNHWSLIKPLG